MGYVPLLPPVDLSKKPEPVNPYWPVSPAPKVEPKRRRFRRKKAR